VNNPAKVLLQSILTCTLVLGLQRGAQEYCNTCLGGEIYGQMLAQVPFSIYIRIYYGKRLVREIRRKHGLPIARASQLLVRHQLLAPSTKAPASPQKSDTNMPTPVSLLITQLWRLQTLGTEPAFETTGR
jgi:hypothetical protein